MMPCLPCHGFSARATFVLNVSDPMTVGANMPAPTVRVIIVGYACRKDVKMMPMHMDITQGCSLTVTRSPRAPYLQARATKFLND